MHRTGIRPPLFERLAFSEEESQRATYFDQSALAESVRSELLRLLNTRRTTNPLTSPPTLLDYGIADWTALQAQNSDDRRRMTREIGAAVRFFEPRLQLLEVDVQPIPGQPQRLSIRLGGNLVHDQQQWPVAFILDKSAAGVEVSHERLD